MGFLRDLIKRAEQAPTTPAQPSSAKLNTDTGPTQMNSSALKPPAPAEHGKPASPAAPSPAVQAATAKPEPQPDLYMRDFGDSKTTRKAIYDNVLAAAQQIEPVANTRFSLHLTNPHWIDPEDRSIDERKQAVLTGGTLQRRLRATWEMRDPEGKPVAKRTQIIAAVPHMTNQGTFVINGTEYTLGHQMRLRPGVYHREKENGEVEAHVNIMPGKGLSHHYFLEPSTGVFKVNIGQANMPMFTVLKAMGATDDELRQAWGPHLFAVNQAKDDPRVIDRLYERLCGKKRNAGAGYEEKRQAVSAALNAMQLDPEVTKRTLGHPHGNLTKEVALASSRKLLDISRGHAETDDRDHLAFQNFLGPEDLIAERMGRDKSTMRELLWKATNKGSLDTVPTGAFTKNVHQAITGSGLGQALEEVNAADVLDQQTRVSRLGYGGIPSIDSVPDEARSVQPSHLNYIDLLRTPESFKAGVDSRVGFASKKGSDRRIYSPYHDVKNGQVVYKSPQDVADMTVAFPGEMESGEPLVHVMKGGRAKLVPRNEVHLAMPHMEQAFSPINNMVPLKSALKGQRAAMASRFLTQALPLHEAQSPHVQGEVPGSPGTSFEDHYGQHMGAVKAKTHGRVESVTPKGITVRYADGSKETHELYDHFPYNRKTYVHNTPMVNAGDPVSPGQVLAKSNYTDHTGAVALGKNLRVAYVPFRGANYEDAYVISESAAKHLTSEHMYQHHIEWDEKHRRGKSKYVSIFPATHSKQTLQKVDDDGVIQPGQIVNPGDPLILAARERELSKKQVHSAHKGSFVDGSLTWEHHAPGVVTDVAKTDKGVLVAVKSLNPMQVGDKMSGRYGDKGVVAQIVPDDQMPHDKDGQPFHVLANPLGIISRTNPAQYHEAALGKIAEKFGKKYKINDFSHINDLNEFVQNELKKHGMSDTEPVIDPATGRTVTDPNTGGHPMVGNRFFMKLHHTSESKGQGRGLGAYTAEGMPAKGGEEGSKRMAMMDIHALLSHGAIETLRDAKLIRGQKNQEYWATMMGGFTPPTPQVPMVYNKFVNQLKAAGVNVQRTGSQVHIMNLTDNDVKEMAGDRELENPDTVDWKAGLKPKPGGLFDERLTGGHNGNRWAKITLAEPMPNPVMEEPIRRLLGLTKEKFLNVLGGREKLNGKSGPQAIQSALSSIDVDQQIEQARADIASGRKTKRDEAVRKLGYLKGAQKNGIHPKEWMVNAIPVIPPIFRPVSVMQNNAGTIVGDANYLYKEAFDANTNLREHLGKTDDPHEVRMNLYNSFKAVTGLGDPTSPKLQDKKVRGMLAHIFGHAPKFGTMQQKLLGTTVDLVGRAVVVPNPDLHMDQLGLPEARAWEVYTPFVVRRLVRSGVPRTQALQYVKDRHDVARKAMLAELNERPVIMTRAPVLHRLGEMAFYPRLTKGDTVQVSPIVTKGFGMDFDGDAVNYHVPASDTAARELTEKLLPSKNLISTKNFKAENYVPSQEYIGGLYTATNRVNSPDRRTHTFATKTDALRAINSGRIPHDAPITIINEKK